MNIEILGAESLGVRGLASVVRTGGQTVVIDPGVALGYRRFGLPPHPVQIAAGKVVRAKIVAALGDATDVVISHFHGDHIPLADANPFQLPLAPVVPQLRRTRVWMHGSDGLSPKMIKRRRSIETAVGRALPPANGLTEGALTFSKAVPHGRRGQGLGTVMMTRVSGTGTVFVHASDIQLLDNGAIDAILEWEPDVVLASGPPLYRQLVSIEEPGWERYRSRGSRACSFCAIEKGHRSHGGGLSHAAQARPQPVLSAWGSASGTVTKITGTVPFPGGNRLQAPEVQLAWNNALRLAGNVETLILDHHLLRSLEGEAFLYELSQAVGHRVWCAADFMARPRTLLEARRRELYRDRPVAVGGHDAGTVYA